MDSIINWNLLKHPMNWIIVVLMVLIFGIAANFTLNHLTGHVNAAK